MKSLMLFNRDLRVEDNLTLRAACNADSLVCGVLRQDTSNWGESKRHHYTACLGNLAHSLRAYGHKLYTLDNLDGFDG